MAAIEVQGLRKSYGANEVLRGIDFEVQANEVFGFLGPKGMVHSLRIPRSRLGSGFVRPAKRPAARSLTQTRQRPRRPSKGLGAAGGSVPGGIMPRGVTCAGVNAGQRAQLRAALTRNGDRLAALEHRVEQMEAAVGAFEDLERRIAALERPRPLAGPELRRIRDEEIFALRAEGRSLAAISQRIGLSKSAVSRVVNRNGNDPAPERVVGTGGGRYYSRLSAAHPRSRNGTRRPVRLEGIDRISGDHVTVYGELSVFPR